MNHMKVTANITVLAKIQRPWTDSTGTERTSYSANIMQNNGEIIDTLRLSLEQYNTIEANKQYLVNAEYGTGKNGAYLRLIDINPLKVSN